MKVEKLKLFSQDMEKYPTFAFYFPENIGEQVKIHDNVFELQRDGKQKIRVMVSGCPEEDMLEEYAKKWIEKSRTTNNQEIKEFLEEEIGDIRVLTYILVADGRSDRIYKIFYIDRCYIVISGNMEEGKKEIINKAIQKICIIGNREYFQIRNNIFDIESAEIEGEINKNSQIKISINIKMQEKIIDGKALSPCLYIENGIKMYIESLNNLDNAKFHYDLSMGDKEGWKLYGFENKDISSGNITISHKENDIFGINWNGIININGKKDIPFSCICDAKFSNWSQIQRAFEKVRENIIEDVKNKKNSTLILKLSELRAVLSEFDKYDYERIGEIIDKLNNPESVLDEESKSYLSNKNLFNARWLYDKYGPTVNGKNWADYVHEIEKICESELHITNDKK